MDFGWVYYGDHTEFNVLLRTKLRGFASNEPFEKDPHESLDSGKELYILVRVGAVCYRPFSTFRIGDASTLRAAGTKLTPNFCCSRFFPTGVTRRATENRTCCVALLSNRPIYRKWAYTQNLCLSSSSSSEKWTPAAVFSWSSICREGQQLLIALAWINCCLLLFLWLLKRDTAIRVQFILVHLFWLWLRVTVWAKQNEPIDLTCPSKLPNVNSIIATQRT